jgi:hypothetical protein
MYYKDLVLGSNEQERSIKLVENFLEKSGNEILKMANAIMEDGVGLSDIFEGDLRISDFKNALSESLKGIDNVYRDFRIEAVTDGKSLFKKLDEVGLTFNSLEAKFSLLDWWHFKATDMLEPLSQNKNGEVFDAYLSLLKAILNSICKALGFGGTDIFNEAIELFRALIRAIFASSNQTSK